MKPKTLKILIANGVNLDLLGQREPELYGSQTLNDLSAYLTEQLPYICQACQVPLCQLHMFQSNDEGAFLNELNREQWDGAIINPGAWTHTSLALGDRLAALELPFIEIHLSHLGRREDFRKHSYSAAHALGVVYGLGFESYTMGLFGLLKKLS